MTESTSTPGAMMEMPRYKSHKTVHALQIRSWQDYDNGIRLRFTDPSYGPAEIYGDEAERMKKVLADISEDKGYLVVYEDGYRSISPSKAFEEGYTRLVPGGQMTFSEALEEVKRGHRAARYGWNGVDMFIFLVPGSHFEVNRPPLLGIYPEGTPIDYRDHIDMRTADGSIVPWLASQTDLIAEDWYLVR